MFALCIPLTRLTGNAAIIPFAIALGAGASVQLPFGDQIVEPKIDLTLNNRICDRSKNELLIWKRSQVMAN
jgi:hypothetical protein